MVKRMFEKELSDSADPRKTTLDDLLKAEPGRVERVYPQHNLNEAPDVSKANPVPMEFD